MIPPNAIPWSELEDAAGPATGLPVLLNRLVASSTGDFFLALGELGSLILHEGTFFTATPHATAFLLDLLPHLALPERKAVYPLLWELAASARYSLRPDHVHIPSNAGGLPEVASAIRHILDAARPQFERDSTHPDDVLRRAATHLTLAFPRTPADVLQRAAERYPSEPSAPVRRELLSGLLRSRPDFPDWSAFLASSLLTEQIPSNRFLLHYAQVIDSGPDTPPAVIDDLVAALIASLHHDVIRSTIDGNEFTWFLEAISTLGPDRHRQALLAALQRSPKEGLALSLARQALALAFADTREGWRLRYTSVPPAGAAIAPPSSGDDVILRTLAYTLSARLPHSPPHPSYPPGTRSIQFSRVTGPSPSLPPFLTPAQRETLETIANHPPLWQCHTNLWALYQLPDTPEALRAFLAAHA